MTARRNFLPLARLACLACLAVVALSGCYGSKRSEPRAPTAPPDAGRIPSSSGRPDGDPSKPREPAPLPDAQGTQPEAAIPEDPLAPIAVMPEPNLRIAFIGDQGVSGTARAVLELIRSERASLVVHAGDLSYGQTDVLGWEAQLDDVLGRNFPYAVAAGNHDLDDWKGPQGFEAVLERRLTRTPHLRCSGELGLKQLCRFRGLELVLSGVGTTGTDHEWYLERMLARPGALIRLCVWHKNQRDMQVGGKVDEVGWPAYQICARHGAPIITGHEHSYSRTYTLQGVGNRQREHGKTGAPDLVKLARDSTFVVVTGLGGHSARTRTFDHANDTWWASIYANDYQMQNSAMMGTQPIIDAGALFIDFHVDGDPLRARAYFKTTGGLVVDRFELEFAARE